LTQLLLGLYGKGTRVFAVKEGDTDRHVVIKDCWDPSKTASDYLVHQKLQDPGRDPQLQKVEGDRYNPVGILPIMEDHSERNFAEQNDDHCSRATIDPWDNVIFLRGITIMERFMQPLGDLLCKDLADTPSALPPESIRSVSAAMGYRWDTPNQPRLDDRHRHRTLFKTCGVDILWFGTAREMIHAVAGAVIGERSLVSFYQYSSFLTFLLGHQNAYEKRQILHADVSDGNTLMLVNHISGETAVPSPPDNPSPRWTPLRHGMASDWGSAADCQQKERLRRTVSPPILHAARCMRASTEIL
jgi:hypothetical protein